MQDHVTDENFILYAARNYESTCISEEEFYSDLSKIKYISKMFNRYESSGVINESLVLNYIRLLYNVFQHEAMTRILVFKLKDHLHLLKPFLMLLNYWPEKIVGVGRSDSTIIGSDISMDDKIVQVLRKL